MSLRRAPLLVLLLALLLAGCLGALPPPDEEEAPLEIVTRPGVISDEEPELPHFEDDTLRPLLERLYHDMGPNGTVTRYRHADWIGTEAIAWDHVDIGDRYDAWFTFTDEEWWYTGDGMVWSKEGDTLYKQRLAPADGRFWELLPYGLNATRHLDTFHGDGYTVYEVQLYEHRMTQPPEPVTAIYVDDEDRIRTIWTWTEDGYDFTERWSFTYGEREALDPPDPADWPEPLTGDDFDDLWLAPGDVLGDEPPS